MKTGSKVYVTIVLLAAVFFTLVLGTAAWFSANREVSVNKTTITAAKSISMAISIPSQQANTNAYLGQTGIQYSGLDSPYFLRYLPIDVYLKTEGAEGLYFFCDITEVGIKSVVTSEIQQLSKSDIEKNFTWRFVLSKYERRINPDTGEEESVLVETTFKNQNGFFYNDEGGVFSAEDNAELSFTLYLYFLGEKGLSLMERTKSDIPAIYTFDYCDVSYMWSTFYINIEMGIRTLYEIRFDSRGGSAHGPLYTTGGSEVSLPEPTVGDDTVYFAGWYDNPEGFGAPYLNDTFLTTPLRRSVTLYARWLPKP